MSRWPDELFSDEPKRREHGSLVSKTSTSYQPSADRRQMDNQKSSTFVALSWVGGILAVILLIWVIAFGIDSLSSRATPQAGYVGVVREGTSSVWGPSWFNGHGIRGVVPPNSGSKFIGLGSKVHYYPDSSVQRQYTITSDPNQGDEPGVDYVQVPTSDGVEVGLEGTFYFTTNFGGYGEQKQALEDFDNRFGVRQFNVDAQSSSQLYPWQGNDGWEAFLNTAVRPTIDNDLRETIAGVSCAQLVSSCALVHNNTATVKTSAGQTNTQSIQKIQDAINSSLNSDIVSALGGHSYFSNVKFLLAKVALPSQIQDQINNAQAQFAAVGSAQAKVQQAHLTAQANKIKEQGYQNCPACAQIDEYHAIPPNVTTFAPGASYSVTSH